MGTFAKIGTIGTLFIFLRANLCDVRNYDFRKDTATLITGVLPGITKMSRVSVPMIFNECDVSICVNIFIQ